MLRFKLISVILVLFSLVLSFLIIFSLNFPSIKLFVWGVNFNLPNWQSYNVSSENGDSLEIISKDLKITIVKSVSENNSKFINDKKELLRLLFEPTTSPYPEFITNIVKCGDEFKPKKQVVKNGVIYNLYAGERFNYGVCSKDLVRYYSRYGIFDCGRKGIFEVNLFSTDDLKIDKIIKSFKCN